MLIGVTRNCTDMETDISSHNLDVIKLPGTYNLWMYGLNNKMLRTAKNDN